MPTMRLRTAPRIRTRNSGTMLQMPEKIHNIQNSRYCRSGRTTCSNNHTMGHRFTACMVWAHKPTVCSTGQQCGSSSGHEQEDSSWFTFTSTSTRLLGSDH
eukprot:5873457-Amphidinium_carterae.1